MAETLTVTYNGVTITNPRGWTYAQAPVMTFDGMQVMAYDVTYTVEGYFAGNTSATDRKADFDTLRAALNEPAKDFAIVHNGVTIHAVTAAQAHSEGPWPQVEIPGGTSGFKAGYQVPFTFTVKARIDPVLAGDPTIQARAERTDYQQDDQERLTRTLKGQLKVKVGASALAQLATVTPAIPSGYERRSVDYGADPVDLVLDYTFVDAQPTDDGANPTGAGPTSQWGVSCVYVNGSEQWVLSGRLLYKKTQKFTLSDIDALVSKLLPSDVTKMQRDYKYEPRTHTLEFTVTALRSPQKDQIVEYSDTLSLSVSRTAEDFKSLDKNAKDEREDYARPTVTLVQQGRAKKIGGYPNFPGLLVDDVSILDYDEQYGEIVRDEDGGVGTAEISWRYRAVLLNEVEAGELGELDKLAPKPSEIQDADPRTKVAAQHANFLG